jgi:hypothetical protein
LITTIQQQYVLLLFLSRTNVGFVYGKQLHAITLAVTTRYALFQVLVCHPKPGTMSPQTGHQRRLKPGTPSPETRREFKSVASNRAVLPAALIMVSRSDMDVDWVPVCPESH